MAGSSAGGVRAVAEDARVVGDSLGPVEAREVDATLDSAKAEVKGAVSDLKGAAVEHGRALYEAAREQATSFADQRKNETAQSVADIAASIRETGRGFDDRPNIQAFVGSAADGLDQLAGAIRERSIADLYAEVEDVARRSPVAVGVVAAVAGFLLARFIKSSADELSEAGAASRAERRRVAASAGRPR